MNIHRISLDSSGDESYFKHWEDGFDNKSVSGTLGEPSVDETISHSQGSTGQIERIVSDTEKEALASANRKRLVKQVGITALSILLAPAIFIVGLPLFIQVNKLSKLTNDKSIWDKHLSQQILPSAFITFEKSELTLGFTKPFKLENSGVEINGLLVEADHFEVKTNQPPKYAVLFCTNGNHMLNWDMQEKAKDYIDKGINVILFNYRGVNVQDKSKSPPPTKCGDLCTDGKAVVDALIRGLKLGDDSVLAPTPPEHIILEGHSIGGAVATYVGSEYPEATLVVDRSFTSWQRAAENIVKGFSNPIVAKIIKLFVLSSEKTELDTLKYMEKRLQDPKNANVYTIVENVVADKIITGSARLTEEKIVRAMKGKAIQGKLSVETFAGYSVDEKEYLYHHMEYKYPRTELQKAIDDVSKRNLNTYPPGLFERDVGNS